MLDMESDRENSLQLLQGDVGHVESEGRVATTFRNDVGIQLVESSRVLDGAGVVAHRG